MKKKTLIAIIAIVSFAITGCNNGSTGGTKPWETATVNFKALVVSYPATTLDFSPTVALPKGVTYTLTDNRPTPNTWNSASGFNGQVNASTYALSDTNVTFTQTFYLNGKKLTGAGSERSVVINVDDFPVSAFR